MFLISVFNCKRLSFQARYYWVGMVITLFSCQSESIYPSSPDIPEEVVPYLNRFKNEAARRGVIVSWEDLEIRLVDGGNESKAAGTCHLYHSRSPKILIDTTSFNWKHSEWTREILIFHELGHSVLNRSHRNDRFPNGLYASIMRDSGDPLYGGDLNAFKRSYYLDELFDQDISRPEWATNAFNRPAHHTWNRTIVFRNDFNDGFSDWPERETSDMRLKVEEGKYVFSVKDHGAYFSGKMIPLDIQRDFEVEVLVRISDGDNPVLLQWGGKTPSRMLYLGFTQDRYAFAGKRNAGTFTGRKFLPIHPRDFNLLTIQKIDAKYYLYINEQLFDTITFSPYEGDLWGFYLGSMTTLEIDFMQISYLTQGKVEKYASQ